MSILMFDTVGNGEDWTQNLQMDVSREITKRIATSWFQQMGWDTNCLPSDQLTAIYDLRAFHRVAREEVFGPLSPLDRKGKLDEWLYSLAEAFQGRPHSDAAAAIAETVEKWRIPRAFLYEQLTSIESNLFHERLVVDNDLLRLAYRQTGTFMLMVSQLMELDQPPQRDFFICFGISAGLLEIVLDWSHWESSGWLPVPLNWLPAKEQQHAGWYQADWQKPFVHLSKSRQQLIPNLQRRIATLGIETMAHASPTDTLNRSPFADLLRAWLEQTLSKLHEVYQNPESGASALDRSEAK